MTKREMISESDAMALMGGKKIAAKGKRRRTEIQHDADLENKMTDHVAKKRIPKGETQQFSAIRGGALRGLMEETMARVYSEFWPGMQTHDENEKVDTEIREEVYILSLTMLVGNDEYQPRKGLRMKEIDGFGDSLALCGECA